MSISKADRLEPVHYDAMRLVKAGRANEVDWRFLRKPKRLGFVVAKYDPRRKRSITRLTRQGRAELDKKKHAA